MDNSAAQTPGRAQSSSNNDTQQYSLDQNVNTPKLADTVILVQLAGARLTGPSSAQVEGHLMRNIEGAPCQLRDIPTFSDLINYVSVYLENTLIVHGLSMEYVTGAYFTVRNADGGMASKSMMTKACFENNSNWTLLLHEMVAASHPNFKPILYLVFNSDHVQSALSSRGIDPRIGISMVDHVHYVWGEKYRDSKSSAEMKEAIFTMIESPRNRAAILDAKPPMHLPLMKDGQYIGAVLLNPGLQFARLIRNSSMSTSEHGLLNLAWTSADGSKVWQGHISTFPDLPAVHLSIAQVEQFSVASDVEAGQNFAIAPSQLSILKSDDWEDEDDGRMEVEPEMRQVDNEVKSKERKAAKHKRRVYKTTRGIGDKWSKAAIQPTGDKKEPTDFCLTCIKFARICKGTELVNGKCENCVGGKGKGHGGRRCYWKAPDQNINTYDDARNADPAGRHLPQNSRAARAAKIAKAQAHKGQETPSESEGDTTLSETSPFGGRAVAGSDDIDVEDDNRMVAD